MNQIFDITTKKNYPLPEKLWLSEGTSYVGKMQIPYQKLIDKLGKSNQDNDGYKVDAEWLISTPAGIATIYNYKTGKNYCRNEGLEVEQITDWHIGGNSKNVVAYIGKFLELDPFELDPFK